MLLFEWNSSEQPVSSICESPIYLCSLQDCVNVWAVHLRLETMTRDVRLMSPNLSFNAQFGLDSQKSIINPAGESKTFKCGVIVSSNLKDLQMTWNFKDTWFNSNLPLRNWDFLWIKTWLKIFFNWLETWLNRHLCRFTWILPWD